jgi:microcystin-dependent protein
MPGKKFTEDSKVHLANAKALEDFAQSIYTQLIPIGALLPYAGTQAPTGYLMCNGSAVSRTTYVALFTVIGTVYGVGDGSTTFNLPNFQSASATTMRVPGGAGVGFSLGTTSGNALSNAATSQGAVVAVNFIIRSG